MYCKETCKALQWKNLKTPEISFPRQNIYCVNLYKHENVFKDVSGFAIIQQFLCP